MHDILVAILNNGRGLRRLELIKANFNDLSYSILEDIIRSSKCPIAYLDISWNDIPALRMQSILEVLSKNRRI